MKIKIGDKITDSVFKIKRNLEKISEAWLLLNLNLIYFLTQRLKMA
jgi:hypothetical protein